MSLKEFRCFSQAQAFLQSAALALLSVAQSTVMCGGLAAGLAVCVRGVARGTLTVGDVVSSGCNMHTNPKPPDRSPKSLSTILTCEPHFGRFAAKGVCPCKRLLRDTTQDQIARS